MKSEDAGLRSFGSSGGDCGKERIRVREAFVSLTQLGGSGSRSFGSLGKKLFDVLVFVVALTDFRQTGKMEFHRSFDLTRWNVVTTRFKRSATSSGRPNARTVSPPTSVERHVFH